MTCLCTFQSQLNTCLLAAPQLKSCSILSKNNQGNIMFDDSNIVIPTDHHLDRGPQKYGPVLS